MLKKSLYFSKGIVSQAEKVKVVPNGTDLMKEMEQVANISAA
ncbi:hypothetical protein [Peribacillus simplex]